MKNQAIEVGDYVYIPTHSNKTLLVEEIPECMNWLKVVTELDDICFTKQGLRTLRDNLPFVFLATPENKAKIEQFYGIELEDVPNDDTNEVKKFEKLLSRFERTVADQNNNPQGYPATTV